MTATDALLATRCWCGHPFGRHGCDGFGRCADCDDCGGFDVADNEGAA